MKDILLGEGVQLKWLIVEGSTPRSSLLCFLQRVTTTTTLCQKSGCFTVTKTFQSKPYDANFTFFQLLVLSHSWFCFWSKSHYKFWDNLAIRTYNLELGHLFYRHLSNLENMSFESLASAPSWRDVLYFITKLEMPWWYWRINVLLITLLYCLPIIL